jgi:hypothetical protein
MLAAVAGTTFGRAALVRLVAALLLCLGLARGRLLERPGWLAVAAAPVVVSLVVSGHAFSNHQRAVAVVTSPPAAPSEGSSGLPVALALAALVVGLLAALAIRRTKPDAAQTTGAAN